MDVYRWTRSIHRGDREAFATFYETRFDRAFLIARSISRRDESFCLDVVQDAMLRVLRSIRPQRSEETLDRWFARVVRTTTLDHLRRDGRRARREERAATRARETAVDLRGADLDEKVDWLRSRLSELKPSERKLLQLRYADGKTLDSVGVALGVNGNTAHGRIRRVLERLRAQAGRWRTER